MLREGIGRCAGGWIPISGIFFFGQTAQITSGCSCTRYLGCILGNNLKLFLLDKLLLYLNLSPNILFPVDKNMDISIYLFIIKSNCFRDNKL